MAVIVTMILLIFVIPQFESLFKGFGADLPAFTQMVIDMSKFVQTKGWIAARWWSCGGIIGFPATPRSAIAACSNSSTA